MCHPLSRLSFHWALGEAKQPKTRPEGGKTISGFLFYSLRLETFCCWLTAWGSSLTCRLCRFVHLLANFRAQNNVSAEKRGHISRRKCLFALQALAALTSTAWSIQRTNTLMAVPTSSKPAHDFDVWVYIPPDMFSMSTETAFFEEEVGTMAVYSTPNANEPRAGKRDRNSEQKKKKKSNQTSSSVPPIPPCRGHGPLQPTCSRRVSRLRWLSRLLPLLPPARVANAQKHSRTLFHQTRPDSSGRVHELPEESLSTHRLVRHLHTANWHASVWAEFCQWVFVSSK